MAVIGLGYVGLPLALAAADSGFETVGIDQDPERVAMIEKGLSPLLDVPDEEIARNLESGSFRATSETQVLAEADIIVICVPTPLKDELPDMSYIESAGKEISKHLRIGQLVILESTTYPGTTEELLFGLLDSPDLKAGVDFHLGFSPERIDPGNEEFTLRNVPKIVGGLNEQSTELMTAFYSTFIETVVKVSSPKAAEMAKLLENTYRHVNIALVNEIAILCHDLGIDVWEVIDAAATKPFGFQAFYPGPGWGGHCIPVDPAYLSWRVRQMGATARFVDLAREFNDKMPSYVVQRVQEALNEHGRSLKGASILVLGVAYKADVADLRESPAIEIIERMLKSGAEVQYNDPHVAQIRLRGQAMESMPLEPHLRAADLVLIHTAHSAYNWPTVAKQGRLIFDTRNVIARPASNVIRL